MEVRFTDRQERLHRALLTEISDQVDTSSEEYTAFKRQITYHLGGPGILARCQSLFDIFQQLSRRGKLGVLKYDVLKGAFRESNHLDVVDLIEEREKDIVTASVEIKEAMVEGEEKMDTSENTQYQIERKANRIMKILGQITECLKDEEVASINEMLSKIIDLSGNKEMGTQTDLEEIYTDYLLIVEFRAGISVNLIKLSIQSFLMIEDDPEILGKRVKEMFSEMIITQHPTLAMDMQLTDDLLKTYFRLLNEGSEPAMHMRIMIVGMFGVGKTSLRRRLCHENVHGVESTEAIDIFTKSCEVDVEKGDDWIISPDKEKEEVFNARLQTLLEKYKKFKEDDTGIREEQEPVIDRGQFRTEEPKSFQKERLNPIEQEVENTKFQSFCTGVDKRDLKHRIQPVSSLKVVRRPTISIWDFAGHSVYYSTHHFFLNERSIYLLVLDLSKDLNSMVEDNSLENQPTFLIGNKQKYTCLEAFKFWIKSIYIYTKQKEIHSSTVKRRDYSPKIILIGTHKDKITEEQLNGLTHEEYKDSYFEKALRSFTKRPMEQLIYPKKYLLNNFSTTEEESLEFLALKSEIFKIAKEQTPFMNEQIPAKFIPMEREVFYSKRAKKQIMRFQDLAGINKKLELPTDEKKIEVFLAFQHAFGNVIHFNTKALRDTIILKPQWIMDVFKAFLSHKTDKTLTEVDEWGKFWENGNLPRKLIDEILKQRKDLYPLRDHIVNYMEHMDILVRPIHSRKEKLFNRSQNDSNEDQTLDVFYIMPCKLPPLPETPELRECFKLAEGESTTPTLCLYFKQCFLPPFVVHCLLANYVKEMEIKTLNGKEMLFNGLGSFAFKKEEDRYLTMWSFEETLHFKLSFIDKLAEEEKAKFCSNLRKEIEDNVLEIFNFHGKKTYTSEDSSTLFEYRIKCPKCYEQMPCEVKQGCEYICGLFKVSDLIQSKSRNKKCGSCGEITAIEEVLKDWFPNLKDTEEVEEIDECLLDLPEEDKLADLSKLIPEEFVRVLADELDINEKLVENLDTQRAPTEHPCHFIYHVLYNWQTSIETWYELYKALFKVKVNISKEDFIKIIQGEEKPDVLKKTENNMKIIDQYLQKKGNVPSGGCLEEREMACLAGCIGLEFWSLGVRLGVSDVTIQQLVFKLKNNCQQVNLAILREWNRSSEASWKGLIKAMIKSGTNMQKVHKDLAAYNNC